MKDPRTLVDEAASKAGEAASKTLGLAGDLLDDPKKSIVRTIREVGRRWEGSVGSPSENDESDSEDS